MLFHDRKLFGNLQRVMKMLKDGYLMYVGNAESVGDLSSSKVRWSFDVGRREGKRMMLIERMRWIFAMKMCQSIILVNIYEWNFAIESVEFHPATKG